MAESSDLWGNIDASFNIKSPQRNTKRPGREEVAQRYAHAQRLVRTFFDLAARHEYVPLDKETQQLLGRIFSTTSWGFREILLLVVIARLLDSSYKASVSFYACHPRPLFERPIRSELAAHGVPSRQSGPLNMAKGWKKLDYQWADGRRGNDKELAHLFVPLIERMDNMSREGLENFAINLHALFLERKKEQELLAIEAKPEADVKHLHHLCKELIDQVPDGGNTPQRVVGLLFKVYHEAMQTGVVVSGYDDSAHTTNTTSKKVGDFTEEVVEKDSLLVENAILKIYEVSVKSFGQQRIEEAYQAVRNYDDEHGTLTEEVVVICRKKDCHPDASDANSQGIYLGKLQHHDLIFYFVDIYEWIMSQLVRMPVEGRLQFYVELNEYIAHRNTALAVKMCWKNLHE